MAVRCDIPDAKATVATLRDPQVRKQRVFGSLLSFFGLLFLVVGILSGREPLHLKHTGASAPGIVVKLVSRSTSNGGNGLHAVVRFAVSNGDSIQFEDGVGASPPLYRVGEAVQVLYRADSPARSAIVDRGIWNLLPAFIFAAIGLVCLSFGLSMRRRRVPAATDAPAASHAAPASPVVPASVPASDRSPRHPRLWAIALSVIALALAFAPPSHKTGDAATGVLLCVSAALVAAFGAAVDVVAGVVFAGLRTAVAARSGFARGLDAGDSGAAWAAAAGDSPRLQVLFSRYAHFKRGLWFAGIVMLMMGDAIMGMAFLTHALGAK
ncbi:MAG TPA: DUF3592 domain-containing protein [Burkholderiaceae bacterium]